jgi:hypothetical protein
LYNINNTYVSTDDALEFEVFSKICIENKLIWSDNMSFEYFLERIFKKQKDWLESMRGVKGTYLVVKGVEVSLVSDSALIGYIKHGVTKFEII